MIAVLTPFLLVRGPIALLVAIGIVFAETGLLMGILLPGDSSLFTLGVGYEPQVAHLLAQHGFLGSGRVFVHSFDVASLVALHEAAPLVALRLIAGDVTGSVPDGQDTWLRTVDPAIGSVTDTGVGGAQARHLKGLAWPLDHTQSRAAQVERLVDDGVNEIITDNPVLVQHEIPAAGATTTSWNGAPT